MFPALLRWEILALLAVKGLLLATLYVLFFSPTQSHQQISHSMASHILGAD